MIGVGIGIPFFKSFGGIDAQAQAHFNRVIADGGLVPSGLSGVNAFFNTIKTIYGTSDINTAISVGLDPQVLGYKLGAGSGTTLGQAAQKLYSPKDVFGGIGTGNAYWEGSGVTGNFVETPNAAANQITGDIDIIAKVNFLSNSTQDQIVLKANAVAGSSFCYSFFKDGNNIKFAYSNDGTVAARVTSSSSVTLSSVGYTYNTDIWVRVTRTVLNGDVKFYYGSDGINWTQLGATQSTTANSIASAAIPLRIGNWANILYFFTGKIYRVTISNSIGGAPVVDFNPNQYTGANIWTSTTSEVWTVNRTGAGLADVVQTTAASQPLLLVHSGANYWWGSGQLGNFVETQTQSTLLFGADFSATFYCDPLSNTNMELGGNNLGGVNTTGFYIGSDRNMRASYLNILYTSTTTFAIGTKYFRYTMSGNNLQFYTSIDGITWVQLGTNLSVVVHTVMASNRIRVGNATGAYALPTNGKIYNAKFYTDATLTNLVFDFNPNQYNAANSQTQWVSTSGETWTINVGTAATGYKGVLVDRTITMGDGIDDRLTSNVIRTNILTQYLAANPFTNDNSGNSVLIDANNGAWLNSIVAFSSNIGNIMNSFASDLLRSRTPNRLILATSLNNQGVRNSISVNNGAETLNTYSPCPSGNGLNIFSRSGGGTFGNAIINTYISTNGQNNSTVRTAMYDYIKSINGNSF